MTSAPTSHAQGLIDFVVDSPTSYHAAATARDALVAAGFTELDETRAWDLEPGGRYVVVREGSLAAWAIPSTLPESTAFTIVGTHTDSPAFKLKPLPDFTHEGANQVGVEIYGGPILNSWLDRELCFAGRLALTDGRVVLAHTEPIGRIPQLAIHLDRSANEKLMLDKQQHTQPVIGLEHITGSADNASASSLVLGLLAESAGVTAEQIAGYDVHTIPAERPALFGAHREFLASPRLDNLASVYPAVTALATLDPADITSVALLTAFDHEEVGSGTRSGASGPILSDITHRIVEALHPGSARPAEDYLRAIAASVCISSDAGHAVHPNFPGHHDPVVRPHLGAGPLLKINAQQRYATDALGTAVWERACAAAGVHSQPFVSKNTMPCGTTIGPLTAQRLGVTTVDVGPALWSMHSAREMCAVADIAALHDALAQVFRR
jgi:aspartyl aminopeptidase